MLENVKKEVLFYALEAEKSGLCRHKSGNFSCRDKESGRICITPAGCDRNRLRPEDIIVIDEQARVIEAQTGLRPTSETLMHLAIYAQRPDVMAVVHTHSRFATAFAVLGRKIPAIVYEIANLGCKEGFVPVVPYGRPGTAQLAENIAGPVQISDTLLLESHGAVAVGENLPDTLLKAQYLEELAEIYHLALLANGGKEVPHVPLAELKKWAYPSQIQQKA